MADFGIDSFESAHTQTQAQREENKTHQRHYQMWHGGIGGTPDIEQRDGMQTELLHRSIKPSAASSSFNSQTGFGTESLEILWKCSSFSTEFYF